MEAAASLAERARAGERRALSRAITAVENATVDAAELLRALAQYAGHARVVGITGPPDRRTVHPAVLKTVATRAEGIAELADAPPRGRHKCGESHP